MFDKLNEAFLWLAISNFLKSQNQPVEVCVNVKAGDGKNVSSAVAVPAQRMSRRTREKFIAAQIRSHDKNKTPCADVKKPRSARRILGVIDSFCGRLLDFACNSIGCFCELMCKLIDIIGAFAQIAVFGIFIYVVYLILTS